MNIQERILKSAYICVYKTNDDNRVIEATLLSKQSSAIIIIPEYTLCENIFALKKLKPDLQELVLMGFTYSDIAAVLGFKLYEISKYCNHKGYQTMPIYSNKDWLYDRYIVEGMTLETIANKCGVSATTIVRWVHEFGFQKHKKRRKKKKSKLKHCVPTKPLYKQREWLLEKYYIDGHNQEEIAALAGCSTPTVSTWLNKYNLRK